MDSTQAVGWAAVALAGLTMIKNVADSYIARISAKDKLEFDQKLTVIQQQHSSCEDKFASMEKKLDDCHSQHEKSEKDRDELRGQIEASSRDRAQMRDELEELKIALARQHKADPGKSAKMKPPQQPPTPGA